MSLGLERDNEAYQSGCLCSRRENRIEHSRHPGCELPDTRFASSRYSQHSVLVSNFATPFSCGYPDICSEESGLEPATSIDGIDASFVTRAFQVEARRHTGKLNIRKQMTASGTRNEYGMGYTEKDGVACRQPTSGRGENRTRNGRSTGDVARIASRLPPPLCLNSDWTRSFSL